MFTISYISDSLGVIGIVVGCILLWKQFRNKQALYLSLFTVSAGLWALSNGLADRALTPSAVIVWSGLAVIGFNFFASFFLCFTFVFVRRDSRVLWWQATLACVPSIVMAFFAFSAYSVRSVVFPPDGPAQIVVGPLYTVGPVFLYVVFILAYALIVRQYRHAFLYRERMQAWYVVLGSAFALVGLTVFDIVLPAIGELRFFSVGPLTTAILIACTSYAIFRHELADIKVVVQRSFVYTLVLAILMGMYAAIVLGFHVFFQHDSDTVLVVSAGLTMVAGIAGATPLTRWFRKLTDPIFFKHGYVYADALRDMGETLHSALTLEDVERATCEGFTTIFRASSVEVQWGEVVDEMGDPAHDGRSIAVPLQTHKSTLGMLRIGPKRSSDAYTARDHKLVRTVLYQLTTALERAVLHEQVRAHAAELEGRVRERTAEVVRLQEAQAQMMVELSHGLQTPLTVLKNEIDFLHGQFPGNKNVSTFERSVDDLSRFIYELLALARLEAVEPGAPHASVNVSALLGEMLEYFEILAEAQSVTVVADIEEGVRVRADRRQIEEVVRNLLSNALKYMRGSKTRRLAVRLRADTKIMELQVQDSGTGIPPDDLPFVFDKFYRAKGRPDEVIRGTGIGLAVCKRIIESHGGTIRAESTQGSGSVFTVMLPRVAD